MAAVNNFLDKFSTDHKFSIPLPFLWTVSIDDSGLTGEITKALNKVDYKWNVVESSAWTDKALNNILVAQEISIPTEAFDATIMGPDNRGGYMPGYGVSGRIDFLSRLLNINFIETDSDIETNLFRPWIIAIGIDGLINTKLRAKQVTLTQYSRDMRVRKKYVFSDVFPMSTEGNTVNYSGDQEFVIKTVAFGYKKYTIVS